MCVCTLEAEGVYGAWDERNIATLRLNQAIRLYFASSRKMSDDAEPVSVRRTISGLWGAQPPAQLRPIFALRCGIRDDAAIAETHKDKCRKLAQTSSTLIELLVFKIYSDEQFRKSEVGVPPYVRARVCRACMALTAGCSAFM